MDFMVQKVISIYEKVENDMRSHKVFTKIIIGETGWKTYGIGSNLNRIQKVLTNQYFQAYYYKHLRENLYDTHKIFMFYFNSFDEPWKEATGDDGWGLWIF